MVHDKGIRWIGVLQLWKGFRCEVKSLSFNSDLSQPHKHLQVIPLPLERSLPSGIGFPLEPLLNTTSKEFDVGQTFTLPLPFHHLCAKIDDSFTPESLEEMYLKMFHSLPIESE